MPRETRGIRQHDSRESSEERSPEGNNPSANLQRDLYNLNANRQTPEGTSSRSRLGEVEQRNEQTLHTDRQNRLDMLRDRLQSTREALYNTPESQDFLQARRESENATAAWRADPTNEALRAQERHALMNHTDAFHRMEATPAYQDNERAAAAYTNERWRPPDDQAERETAGPSSGGAERNARLETPEQSRAQRDRNEGLLTGVSPEMRNLVQNERIRPEYFQRDQPEILVQLQETDAWKSPEFQEQLSLLKQQKPDSSDWNREAADAIDIFQEQIDVHNSRNAEKNQQQGQAENGESGIIDLKEASEVLANALRKGGSIYNEVESAWREEKTRQ